MHVSIRRDPARDRLIQRRAAARFLLGEAHVAGSDFAAFDHIYSR